MASNGIKEARQQLRDSGGGDMADRIKDRPRKGDLVICSLGSLGLITEDGLREITYPDGNKAKAWNARVA